MVEFGRMAQIDRLEADGWYTDEETHRFEMWTHRAGLIGSPTYMKNPADGLLYACSGGTQRLVEGSYPLLEMPDGSSRNTTYRDGRPVFAQG